MSGANVGQAQIAVTGLGVVAPQAADAAALWRQVEKGSPAPVVVEPMGRWLSRPAAGLPVTEPLEIAATAGRLRGLHRADRAVRLAVVAALRAWEDAGFDCNPPRDCSRFAVVVGSSRGPAAKWAQHCDDSLERVRHQPVRPSMAAECSPASLHGSIAALLGAEGPAYTVAAACSSGGHAVALAASHLCSGVADMVLVGGADAPLHPALLGQYHAAKILDPSLPPAPVCRPFDMGACGTVLGEAGAFLVLETAASARARGARVHAWLRGWGLAADGSGYSPESTAGRALGLATSHALAHAGIDPGMLGYVNVHGTGTRLSDEIEMRWLGNAAAGGKPLRFSSTKPVTGHCLGAAAVLEAVICIEALRRSRLPVNINCHQPRPDALPGLVLESGLPLTADYAMSNATGFWGAASSLIFSR